MKARLLSDGERDIWSEMRADAAPDYRDLWHRRHVARKRHICDACKGYIEPGETYRDDGFVIDGQFERHKGHTTPTPCPTDERRGQAERDQWAAWEADFAKLTSSEEPF